MTEETKNAAKSGPRGIILTIVVSFVVGWAYLLALTFSIQVGRAGFGLCEQCAGAIASWVGAGRTSEGVTRVVGGK